MLNIDLAGQVALVLGGNRGIGAGITATLAKAGATVYFTHRGRPQSAAAVEQLITSTREQGGAATPMVADACNPADTDRVVAEIVARHGRLDHLICNVGQTIAQPAEQTSDDERRHLIDMNLSSAFYSVRAALPHMLARQRGRIVLIGSSVVYDGGGGAIAYTSSKAGIVGMMAYLVRNYARRGISTNVIHPGVIDTDLLRERYGEEAKRAELVEQVPVGRLGRPEDIATLVAYLLSPLGEFICGQAIMVDGARTLF